MITVEKEVYEAVLKNSIKVADLEAENEQLKELLKECKEWINLIIKINNHCSWQEYVKKIENIIYKPLLTKIDEVLK